MLTAERLPVKGVLIGIYWLLKAGLKGPEPNKDPSNLFGKPKQGCSNINQNSSSYPLHFRQKS